MLLSMPGNDGSTEWSPEKPTEKTTDWLAIEPHDSEPHD
jgi:hypothetical protein